MKTIEERLLQRPSAHWVERFEAAGIPCSPINYRAHLYDDPQVQALDMMWELHNEGLGSYKAPGHPIRFSKTPAVRGRGTPVLGQDSDALLAEAGCDPARIAQLRRDGIVR
jgi:crotonobetainyl-CoA:carnitine CoA-transferase CaiB-like acyl-CoA transferase